MRNFLGIKAMTQILLTQRVSRVRKSDSLYTRYSIWIVLVIITFDICDVITSFQLKQQRNTHLLIDCKSHWKKFVGHYILTYYFQVCSYFNRR